VFSVMTIYLVPQIRKRLALRNELKS